MLAKTMQDCIVVQTITADNHCITIRQGTVPPYPSHLSVLSTFATIECDCTDGCPAFSFTPASSTCCPTCCCSWYWLGRLRRSMAPSAWPSSSSGLPLEVSPQHVYGVSNFHFRFVIQWQVGFNWSPVTVASCMKLADISISSKRCCMFCFIPVRWDSLSCQSKERSCLRRQLLQCSL